MMTSDTTMPRPDITAFYDPPSGTVQYLVACPQTRDCALIDPVLDFDLEQGRTGTDTADHLLAEIDRRGLRLVLVLDTHPHADHLSAADYLRERTGVPIGIGDGVVAVQKLWSEIYGLDMPCDGSQWDRLYADGEVFRLGAMDVRVLHSPGHTPASVTYVVGDAAFVHDTLFMPDTGAARADFPGGCPRALWRSIETILAMPDETRLFTGHDYRAGGREACWESTIGEQRRLNPWASKDEATFMAERSARDRALPLPRLMLAALQINIRAGALPEPDAHGRRALTIPLNRF